MCEYNSIVVNCGCCSKGTDNNTGADNTPVGTVISYMGMKAPKHYLACDGLFMTLPNIKNFAILLKRNIVHLISLEVMAQQPLLYLI
jgi:hypothetical protein